MKNRYLQVFKNDIIRKYQNKNPFIKLNDVVYECIKEAINNVLIKPGERINVSEISKALNVSITPVRNAIQKLAEEGLIENRGVKGGYYVFDVNEKTAQFSLCRPSVFP